MNVDVPYFLKPMKSDRKESRVQKSRVHSRAIPFAIIDELRSQYSKTNEAIKKLLDLKKKVKNLGYVHDDDIRQYIVLFQQYAADIKLVLDEAPGGIKKKHHNLIKKVFESSRNLETISAKGLLPSGASWKNLFLEGKAFVLEEDIGPERAIRESEPINQSKYFTPLLKEINRLENTIISITLALALVRKRLAEASGVGDIKRQTGKEAMEPFDVPEGSLWGDVTIRFLDDECIEIKVGKKSFGASNFAALGFEDKKTKQPDKLWQTLLLLGRKQGEITWKEKDSTGKVNTRLKKNISILRTRLKELFGIADDPFYRYEKTKSYRAKFTIIRRAELDNSSAEESGASKEEYVDEKRSEEEEENEET